MTRVPVVLGLGRRSGAGTVTAALHATECRRPPLRGPGSWSADIVVCADDETSLASAAAVRGAAVLLVVLVDDTTPPSHARQQELARRHGNVVLLPHVPEWAGLSSVPDDAVTLFARPPEQLAPALCAYARGLRLAVAALLRTGVLTRPRPSTLTWSPPTSRPVRPAPAVRAAAADGCPAATVSPLSSAPPTPAGPAANGSAPASAMAAALLDDDAIEAEVLAAAAQGTKPSAAAGRPTGRAADVPSAPGPSIAEALALGRPTTHLCIRALHRPVMGPVRVESAKAG